MGKLAIIADDLSSATDCGIQMAKNGLQTHVPFAWSEISSAAQAADVVSIDTDSRALPAIEAYKRVKNAARLVAAAGFSHVYKSMDSTLRGNLGAEVDAVLDVLHVDLAAVAPAFPLYGRTTLNGKHSLNGKPINTTEFATDPQCPVRDDDLVRLFASQSRRKVGLVPLGVLREGNRAVARLLATLIAQKVGLAVFDAEVEGDLDRIAGGVAAAGLNVLWVGSTGLARCIPGALGMHAENAPRPRHLGATDRVLLVVGSASETTRRQLYNLLQEREVAAVELNPLNVIADAHEANCEIERCRTHLVDALSQGKDVVLCVASSRSAVGVAQSMGKQMGLSPLEVASKIVNALGHITQRVHEACELRGIVVTGGDTAKAVCGHLGSTGIRIWDEVEPGIALGQLVGAHEILLVTKAGAFGTPQALVKSVDALKGESCRP